MTWTDRQLETIKLRNTNILVSAAAGSGKTAVLIERIKQLVLMDGVDVDRILVVTFTKAAASEMKEKLIQSLNKAVRVTPAQGERLRNQLDRIPRANISTFHSFALELIRRYFHLIDLDPGFKVCDEAESKLMKADAMDLVFEELFEQDEAQFKGYIDRYASPKNEIELKKNLIGFYDKIRSIPEPFQWLDWAVNELGQPEESFESSSMLEMIKDLVLDKMATAEESMGKALKLLEENDIGQTATLCRQDLEWIESIRASIRNNDWEEARLSISGFKPNTMTVSKANRENYEPIKEHVKGFRDRAKDIIRKELLPKFFSASLSEFFADMKETYPQARVTQRILLMYHERYNGIKRQKSLLDFSDIEHFAIEILKNPTASHEYRSKFQYIFIDEYQDSNLLQETIIDAIRRDDNVFMVGDIKQSIYKFRLAEPEIFQGKYELFKNPNTAFSTKVDLNQNFRSKQSIIDAVNGIFSNLMAYDNDAALYRGIPDLDFPDKPVELHIVNGVNEEPEDSALGDELIEDLKTTELEALAAAGIIKDALSTTIFDVKAGQERPLQKKDIVILMHGVKRRAEIFLQALGNLDIDAYVDDNTGYFDTLEITGVLDLFQVIDNRKRDVPLLGVLRSPIFSFTIDDLIEIRTQFRHGAFHSALTQYWKYGNDQVLKNKIDQTLSLLKKWKNESRYMPIDEFAWKLMRESGYYLYAGALQGGTLRQANLRIFLEKTKAFRNTGDGSIYGLLRYMKALAEKEIETGQASMVGENDDVVRIMTIHKSKGLEFPFVLVASLGSRFVNDKMEKAGVMHKAMGIGLTLIQPDEHWYRHTLIQHGIVAKKRKEELEEAVRVLYVAFTRAMDHLVLLGSVSNWDRDETKYESGAKSESNYLGMIYPHIAKTGISCNLLNRSQLQTKTALHGIETSGLKSYKTVLKPYESDESKKEQTVEQKDITKTINGRLSYHYPNEAQKNLKSKYSVSELNAAHFFDASIRTPSFLEAAHTFNSAEIGSIMHIVMEHIDVKRFHQHDYLTSYLEDLVRRELLLPGEASIVELDKVAHFAAGDLGKRMAAASNLHREHPFNLLHNQEGVEVMVQGVIDCWFEEDGKIILLDYKTGEGTFRIDDRYRAQLCLYKEALENIQDKPVDQMFLYLFSEGRAQEITV